MLLYIFATVLIKYFYFVLEFENRNDKQTKFAEIRGVISELNDNGEYCSVTLMVGHEKLRDVNVVTRAKEMGEIKAKFNLGDMVTCRYYPSSRKKNDKWFTHLILLSVHAG